MLHRPAVAQLWATRATRTNPAIWGAFGRCGRGPKPRGSPGVPGGLHVVWSRSAAAVWWVCVLTYRPVLIHGEHGVILEAGAPLPKGPVPPNPAGSAPLFFCFFRGEQ